MSSKLLDTALFGNLDLIALEGLLLALRGRRSILLIELELLLVVRAKVADQRVEVVEFTLVLGETQLFLIQLHRRVDLSDLLEEV